MDSIQFDAAGPDTPFCSRHSSFLYKPSAYITHNATW